MKHPIFIIAAFLSLSQAVAQEEARQIWDDYFAPARPTAPAAKPAPKPRYQAASSGTTPTGSNSPRHAPSAALGITVWKLEPPMKNDGARLLVQDPGESSATIQLTPHRLRANEPLKPGDRVRLSIEAPSAGYVYIVDQEIYAGDKLGPPYLIFPTIHARSGDNTIRAGQLVEVPGQTDRFKAFLIKPKNPADRGEKLTIILTPQRIPDVVPGEQEQELSAEKFSAWVTQWGTGSQQFELSGGEGRAWTSAEKEAGATQSRLLTQDDPAPQTVFIFPERPGQPVVASVRLAISAAESKGQ